MDLSTCCDAPRWMDLESGICEDCEEHADFYDSEEDNDLKIRSDCNCGCHHYRAEHLHETPCCRPDGEGNEIRDRATTEND